MYRLKTKIDVHPILKWAGGKTQLLPVLLPKVPLQYDRYVEPFVGGAAMYFAIQPEHALISDSNPELINLYRCVADDVDAVIEALRLHQNTAEHFYRIRSLKWDELDPFAAAARMIYLNRTCFNGLYRVNRHGEFNVPFGGYKNPMICDADNLRAASVILKRADIRCADYLEVLNGEVQPGDFVFLDPPYVPVGDYGDFKRYTKEQFYDEDQLRLATAVRQLSDRGCYSILTNSNHPRVHELYAGFPIEVHATKRNISCRSKTRSGEDAVVTILPSDAAGRRAYEELRLSPQVDAYPQTRYMGSIRWDFATRLPEGFRGCLNLILAMWMP